MIEANIIGAGRYPFSPIIKRTPGYPAGTRTPINRTKTCCPTIRRQGSNRFLANRDDRKPQNGITYERAGRFAPRRINILRRNIMACAPAHRCAGLHCYLHSMKARANFAKIYNSTIEFCEIFNGAESQN